MLFTKKSLLGILVFMVVTLFIGVSMVYGASLSLFEGDSNALEDLLEGFDEIYGDDLIQVSFMLNKTLEVRKDFDGKYFLIRSDDYSKNDVTIKFNIKAYLDSNDKVYKLVYEFMVIGETDFSNLFRNMISKDLESLSNNSVKKIENGVFMFNSDRGPIIFKIAYLPMKLNLKAIGLDGHFYSCTYWYIIELYDDYKKEISKEVK